LLHRLLLSARVNNLLLLNRSFGATIGRACQRPAVVAATPATVPPDSRPRVVPAFMGESRRRCSLCGLLLAGILLLAWVIVVAR